MAWPIRGGPPLPTHPKAQGVPLGRDDVGPEPGVRDELGQVRLDLLLVRPALRPFLEEGKEVGAHEHAANASQAGQVIYPLGKLLPVRVEEDHVVGVGEVGEDVSRLPPKDVDSLGEPPLSELRLRQVRVEGAPLTRLSLSRTRFDYPGDIEKLSMNHPNQPALRSARLLT